MCHDSILEMANSQNTNYRIIIIKKETIQSMAEQKQTVLHKNVIQFDGMVEIEFDKLTGWNEAG